MSALIQVAALLVILLAIIVIGNNLKLQPAGSSGLRIEEKVIDKNCTYPSDGVPSVVRQMNFSIDEKNSKGISEALPVKDSIHNVFDRINGALPVNEPVDHTLLLKYPLQLVGCNHPKYPIIMQNTGIIRWVCNNVGERKVTVVMAHVFDKFWLGKKPHLMVDIGANAGYYGLLAAKFGHYALQFDLQPTCISVLRNSILLNGFQDRVRVVPEGVNNQFAEIKVPTEGCDGRFPASAREKNTFGTHNTTVALRPLSDFITDPNQEIMLVKIDTEGNEQRVLEGSMSFFCSKKIHNAIVEFTPGYNFWSMAGIENEDVQLTTGKIFACGYIMISLLDWTILRTHQEMLNYMFPITQRDGQYDVWMIPKEDLVGHDDTNTFDHSLLVI